MEPVLTNEVEQVLSESTAAKVRLSFYSEHEKTQSEFEKLARAKKMDAITLYAQHLFNRALESAYESVLETQARTFKAAAICYVATGKAKTIEEAYNMLGWHPAGHETGV